MLGLRADADQFLQQAQNGNGHKKSYRFAERLNGRFFVSGISGGFEKYHKMKTGADLAPPPKKPQYNYQPVLEKAQREELRKEAEKLLELEEKLAELQRIKEAKRKRERQRQMKKLQFESAVRIQRFWKKNIRQRRERAANILITILKAQKARQAFYAASWAASVLKKFAVEASRRWKKWKFYQRQVKRIASKNWYLIEEIACIWTQARRDVTDQFVHHVLQQGMKNAKQELLARLGKRKKKNVAPPIKKDQSSYFAFFLTEGSTADASVDDDENSEYEDALATDDQTPNAFMRRQQSRYLQYIKAQQNQPIPEKRKIYNHDDYKVKKLVKRHQEVLKKIENEEILRAEKVEKMRKKAQQEADMKKQEEEKLRKQKEQMKIEYKKKMEEENQERIRNYQKLREKKQRLEERKKKELKQEEEERKKMRGEDPMILAKRLRDWQLHVQQLKKVKDAKEAKQHQLAQQDAAQNKNDDPNQRPLHYNPTPEEIAITEARRKAREAEEAQIKESIRLRIKEKMQYFAQQKKQKEMEEKEKKEKLEQFMGSYQEQLQKQKEEFLKKQREKEKQRKLEEKRAKQEQKEKEKAMIEAILREQEEKDAAELAQLQAMDDADKRVIASAQDYDDQMPMEDFGFDDFIRKSLTKLYVCPPPQIASNNTNETHLGIPPKWVPTSPEEEKQIQQIKAKVVKTVIKKIPAALRNTPYFKHYFKHTVVNKLMERGIAGAEDEALLHKQTEELLTQLQRKHAVQDDDTDSVVVEQAAAHLLPTVSTKHDSAVGVDTANIQNNIKTKGNIQVNIASVPLAGGFAAQAMAPTPNFPVNSISGNGKPLPLVKSKSANQLLPGQSSGVNNNATVGVRGIKARKLQKEHFPASSPMAFTSVDDPNYQDERLEISKPWLQQQQLQQQQQLKEEAEEETFEDPEDNEDLMALIARAKQRLLQEEESMAPSESTAMKSSQSQPVLQVPIYNDVSVDPTLIPKAAATPIVTMTSSNQMPLPKLPSVQEFLRMQPGPPSLPGAPTSLDNIAARYPLSWEMPGASIPTSSMALTDRGFAASLPVKKSKKKGKFSSKEVSSFEHGRDLDQNIDIGGTDANNTAALTTEKRQTSIIPKPVSKANVPSKKEKISNKITVKETEMTEKEIRERERQIRARRKGPAVKLKLRSQPLDNANVQEEEGDHSDDDLDHENKGTMSLEEYAFVKSDQEYREKPGALPSTGYQGDNHDSEDEEEGNNMNNPLPMTGRSSKPSTAGSTGTAGSSRLRHRLHEYEDYEEKLQADYLALRKKFQEKLKAAAHTSSHNHDMESHNVDGVNTFDDTANTSLDKDADDSVLTRSITDLYVAVGEPIADKDGKSPDNQVEHASSTDPADTESTSKHAEIAEEELRRQLQVTTKDLLRAWAMEDEIERRRDLGENVNDDKESYDTRDVGRTEGEETATNLGYRDIRLSDLDEEAAAEYMAWLRSQEGYEDEEEGEEEEEEDSSEFDPIAAHMTQRKKEATSRQQEHKLQKSKLILPIHREAAEADEDEDDDEDTDDILYDEEKALMLAERRQRRRQQELAAMKKSEADKKQFWEALINGPK